MRCLMDRRVFLTGAATVFGAAPFGEPLVGGLLFHSGMYPNRCYDKECWHTAKGFTYLRSPPERIVPVRLSEWSDHIALQCGELGYVGWSVIV